MDNADVSAEWGDILRDLNALSETTITYNGKSFAVRSNAVGVAGKIAQCVGVRLPNTVCRIERRWETPILRFLSAASVENRIASPICQVTRIFCACQLVDLQ